MSYGATEPSTDFVVNFEMSEADMEHAFPGEQARQDLDLMYAAIPRMFSGFVKAIGEWANAHGAPPDLTNREAREFVVREMRRTSAYQALPERVQLTISDWHLLSQMSPMNTLHPDILGITAAAAKQAEWVAANNPLNKKPLLDLSMSLSDPYVPAGAVTTANATAARIFGGNAGAMVAVAAVAGLGLLAYYARR
jgi:hypothetical protein